MQLTTLAVVGGDARQLKLAELLNSDGYAVKVCGFEKATGSDLCFADVETAVKKADILVLPAPTFDKNGDLVTQCSDCLLYTSPSPRDQA